MSLSRRGALSSSPPPPWRICERRHPNKRPRRNNGARRCWNGNSPSMGCSGTILLLET